ncbi:ABC transporter substrate-binding protein [Paenibacillus turpanensis]|uniref:ABC transporter substrate-binding protein n=1 Tax=Paenibacillus turpanensis TaxID=2689078 RepID=UPI001FB7D6E1|nr:ABC transporter substrate-binding protein [Paenibacillus turpanensis]
MRNQKWVPFSMACIVAVMLGGCGTSETTVSPKDAQGTAGGANAAQTEKSNAPADAKASVKGTLSFYTSQPEEDATKLVTAFNKKYPDVKVETFRSGTEEVIAKLQAEKQAGSVQADVLLVADSVTFESLKQQKLLLSYKSPELASIPANLADPDGMYTGTKVMATVLAVNTQKVKALPDSWKVLTEAESKGKSIMPSPLYSGAAAYNVGVMTRTDGFGWDFFKGLKSNEMSVVKGNGAVLKAVASGEKSYAMVVDFLVPREKAKGSPVELVYPKEGVPLITEPVGILNGTDNEAAAKAFVDYVLSEEGQKLAAEIGYTPIRKGVQPPQGLKSISDMKVLEGDITKLVEAREQDKKQFTDVFGQ